MVDFWFDFASTYSYLAALRVPDTVRLRPFLLGPLFEQQLGIRDSPFNVRPERGAYMWRDVERLCAKYGLPWRKPSAFPRHSVGAARVACIDAPWRPAFVRAAFKANFAEDRDIGQRAVLASVLEACGVDAEPVLAYSESPEIRGLLRANTSEAMRLGMFGAPSFTVDGELFFGQDRMDDALEWDRRGA